MTQTVRMKALRSFRGDEGNIKGGREFDAKAGNVDSYERHEPPLAVRIVGKGERLAKVEQPHANKAAEDGPLGSRGGRIGADEPPRLSLPGLRRRGRPSKISEDDTE